MKKHYESPDEAAAAVADLKKNLMMGQGNSFTKDAAELASKFPVSIDDLALAARWAALLSTEGVNLPDVMRRYLGSNPSLALRLSIAIGGLDQLAEMCVPISQVYPDRSETVSGVLEGLTLDAQKFQEYTANFAKEQNEGDQ